MPFWDRLLGRPVPKKSRGRGRSKTPEERLAKVRADAVAAAIKTNPQLLADFGRRTLNQMLDPDGDVPDAAPAADPLDQLIAQMERLEKLRSLMPSRESSSELGDIIRALGEGLGGFLRSPMGGAIIAQAASARTHPGGIGAPPAAIPAGPASLPPAAVLPAGGAVPAGAAAPLPSPIVPPSFPAPTPNLSGAVPGDDVPIPLDRFLPLLDLEPSPAAARLVRWAADDERDGDASLMLEVEGLVDRPLAVTLTILRGLSFLPAYHDGATRLLARPDWLRAVRDELAAILDADQPPPISSPSPNGQSSEDA